MAGFDLWRFPPPSYEMVHTFSNTEEDFPGPRCGHTLTAVYDRLIILFGGVATLRSSGSEISLEGATNSVHCFDVSTREWIRVYPYGEPPSPRAGHAAVSKGTLILIQGGIGPSGLCTGDLHILDVTSHPFIWQKVLVEEDVSPGPRYGHVMGLADNKIVIFGGRNEENDILADTWALNTTQLPNVWERLNPYGDSPSERMYASGSTRDSRYFMVYGGRDFFGMPLGDAYSLEPLSGGGWLWTRIPGLDSSRRYQHTAVFVNQRLHVIGGAQSKTRLVDAETAVSVLDTSTGVWIDTRDGQGIYKRDSDRKYFNPNMRRCHHDAVSVGNRIYVYGGFREGVLLGDLLVSEEDKVQPPSFGPANPYLMGSSSASSWDRWQEAPRLPETVMNYSYMPYYPRQNSTQDLVNKVISTLLRPQTWEPPVNRMFFLSYPEVVELCTAAKQIIVQEPTVLQLNVPIKVFGDLHGQFGDLMRLFYEYGYPSRIGDISYIDYLFLGDYVDRGKHSLETLFLLLALKIEYPKNIHLIRGNHESRATNSIYGFHHECIERIGWNDGENAFTLINELFNHLPLAALIEKKIFCMHGGIGSSVISVEQIANIKRPVFVDCQSESRVVKDLLWSDPTANDSVLGIGTNQRGGNVVSFGPDRVKEFCEMNNIELIIRAHECVLDGFERFAQGKLITVFSATNYCGLNNAGAILVIGRDLGIVAKLIHPLLAPISDNFPDRVWMEVDNKRPTTPVRERPKPDFEQGSTS